MKAKILKLLRAQKDVVSGEVLSSALGISRVSIWKHIQKLRQVGYQIQTGPKGYQLEHSPDIPFAWEFSGRESKIHYFDEVTSTMQIAKDLAHKGCPDFTVVIAGHQKKGRGRLNRIWISDVGGLYFTLVLRPRIPVALSSRVSFLASMTLAHVLRKLGGLNAKLKWPNDILVDERKVSGMLTEMEAEADQVNFINIGIGINVNNEPVRSELQAASLKELLGRPVSRRDLLDQFLNEFEARMRQADFDRVVSEWKKYTITLNRHVRIVTTQETSEGLAVDVDESGALILKTADGSLKKILYGDCFHQD
jgi:BirA family biotin operon repressor/biotin-[acetyl-CoA-carboxylase] ligase